MLNPLHILAISPGTGFDRSSWARVLGSGVEAFMLREPALEAGALLTAAQWCRQNYPDIQLWVNGRLDVALAVGIGLHAPEAYPEDLGNLVPLSRPLHVEAQYQGRQGADQLLVAPVFAVPGKGAAWGPHRLHSFLEHCPEACPRMLALGGVKPERMKELKHPRLAGVALIRAVWEAHDPQTLIAQLREAWAG